MSALFTNAIRTIRLSEADINAVFDRLDATETSGARDRRATPRYAYRAQMIIVELKQPGAKVASPFVCPTRNLSRGGLACLHGGFVHSNTRCLIHLQTLQGGLHAVAGSVVRCRHIQGNVHEVGVRFDEPLDPAPFCSEAEPLPTQSNPPRRAN